MPSPSRAERLVLGGSLLLFLLFAAAWIRLPGPQQDELLHAPVLLPALRPSILFSLKFNHGRLPLMMMSYVGALKGWLLWFWFLVVPMGVPGYRSFAVAAGAATVWLIFWFVRRYWGSAVAATTTALVATDPSFVHTIRLDYGPVALMHLFKMGGLCLLARWLASGSRTTLAAAAFLLGLGLWDKANFLWLLAGLGGTLVLLWPREAFQRLRANRASLAIAAIALLIGAAPLIGYNLKRHGETWREHGRLEFRWSKILQAKGTFDGTFMAALTGEDHLAISPPAHDVAWAGLANAMFRIGRLRQTILLPLLGLAALLLPVNLWLLRRAGSTRRLLFPLLLSLLMYACMFVTFEGGASAHHLIMLEPFPLLFLAVSLWTPVEAASAASGRPRRTLAAAAVTITIAAAAVNVSVNARYLAIYTRTGGTAQFTDAIYRLVPYLAQHPERRLFAIDWGFSTPVAFVGWRSKLDVDDFFFSVNAPDDPGHAGQVHRLGELMRDPNNVFLLHTPQRTLLPLPAREFSALADGGIEMQQVAYFAERSGELVYEIYQHGGAPAARTAGVLAGAPAGPAVQVEFLPERVAPR
ncbi:MAG TPA: glycosyltransferase family 39 protein, partial [Bryobacterales bacterium]|nr:glycosyltransferase family 39 protein [Bryobacterales bacterium]